MYTMDNFEDVTLAFDGKEYTVESDRIWNLLRQLENVMGYDFLIQKLAVNDVPSMHVYEAYAIALRAAGHKTVNPQMVMKGVNKETLYMMALALAGILRMTQPPEDIETMAGAGVSEKDAEDIKKKDSSE